MTRLAAPWLAMVALLAACDGQAPSRASGRASEPNGPGVRYTVHEGIAVPEGVAIPRPVVESPGGEMAPGPVASPAADPGRKEDIVSIDDRAGLLSKAGSLLACGNAAEAAGYADVILIRNPDDAEALELRGRALERSGDKEGATRDLGRCCRLLRESCCAKDPGAP
ncbi:MAG: tetratricopeptide repeat protein [Deltaproteobacteria bacterium]|nr:tetratricopeptide repeat protein [Deltaproteobacteria bacterium]